MKSEWFRFSSQDILSLKQLSDVKLTSGAGHLLTLNFFFRKWWRGRWGPLRHAAGQHCPSAVSIHLSFVCLGFRCSRAVLVGVLHQSRMSPENNKETPELLSERQPENFAVHLRSLSFMLG